VHTQNSQYICVMFPYPSGQGLHVGHCYNYMIADSICRWKRHQGVDVFQPFGYDAFGLPAENYARSIGADPKDVTWDNIERFRAQMAHMNTQFDERLVTCTPQYTKWTQYFARTRLGVQSLARRQLVCVVPNGVGQ